VDGNGARHLAARLAAGVPVGATIELTGDEAAWIGLRAGARGVVRKIVLPGRVLVAWESGIELEIDRAEMPYRALAA
jgi:hypothetical protein